MHNLSLVTHVSQHLVVHDLIVNILDKARWGHSLDIRSLPRRDVFPREYRV